jgi:hypothetical protein
MEGLNKPFAAIANGYLHDICIRENPPYAISCSPIGNYRIQAALKRVDCYNYFSIHK